MIERGERKRTAVEVSKADWAMSKPGADPASGISLGEFAIPSVDGQLNFGGAAHCLYRTRELGHYAVSGAAENASSVPSDQIVNDLAMSLEGSKSSLLVPAH